MSSQAFSPKTSTLQEWSSFLSVLNGIKKDEGPLLKKSGSAQQIILHLEKQLPKPQQPAIFRRLGKHTQLALHFS